MCYTVNELIDSNLSTSSNVGSQNRVIFFLFLTLIDLIVDSIVIINRKKD